MNTKTEAWNDQEGSLLCSECVEEIYETPHCLEIISRQWTKGSEEKFQCDHCGEIFNKGR